MAIAPVCTIDALGAHAPDFATVLNWVVDQYKAIYGSDSYVGNDAKDGQFLGLLAAALHDSNGMGLAIYSSFAPQTAQGAGLDAVIKVNGITRRVPSNSQVLLTIVGQAGTTLVNATALDAANNIWLIPSPTVIPSGGSVTVTATCRAAGAVLAGANTITTIGTPTRGWQSVTNATAATPGNPVETDAELKQRQTISTMLPSTSILDGIAGAVAALPGVTQVMPYENATGVTDSNGIPSHNIALVVAGGDAQAVAETIALKKTPGTPTYGSVSKTVTDTYGIPHTVNFFAPTQVAVNVQITLHNLAGYTTLVGEAIAQAVINYINDRRIGQSVYLSRLYVPASLQGPYAAPAQAGDATTFEITNITQARGANPLTAADVVIAFNEEAVTGTVTIVVA